MEHDCKDAGGRTTHGAVAEKAKAEKQLSRVMPEAITELPNSLERHGGQIAEVPQLQDEKFRSIATPSTCKLPCR